MITVYSKPSCVQCTASKRVLDNLGLEYLEKPLEGHPGVLEAAKSNGYSAAPIIMVDDKIVASGFQPEILKAL